MGQKTGSLSFVSCNICKLFPVAKVLEHLYNCSLSYNDKLAVNHMAGYTFMIPVWDHGCDFVDAS